MRLGRKWTFFAVGIAWFMMLCEVRSSAASTWTVTSTADDGSASTLRSVVANANPGDTVTFNGKAFDLGTRLDADSAGWVLEQATAVDASGAISGVGKLNGVQQAFLATPVK